PPPLLPLSSLLPYTTLFRSLATVYYRRVRRTSLLSAGILLVLGVLALVEALRLRDDWLGAKLMPAVVGLVLIVLGAAHLVRPAADRKSTRLNSSHQIISYAV